MTIGRIRLLGLRVALPKTEAIVFGGKRWCLPANLTIQVDREPVQVKANIKYLGLVLDRKWDFGEHFIRLAPRIVGAASALGRLLPNVGGPRAPCRRLFAGVVRSMALYGAPIWADRLSSRNKSLLRRPQRVVALRIIRAYSTVSHAAACLLACTPPWELDAQVLAERYVLRAEARARGEHLDPEAAERADREAKIRLRELWEDGLEDAPYGTRTIGAVLPHIEEWLKRKHGALSYRATQVMTGHGCFGHNLHNIERELGPQCHECGDPDDSAQHTLEVCSRWEEERRTLTAAIRTTDLSLHSVVAAMLGSERKWKAVVSFCEEVISQKEAAEREREDAADAPPLRQRRRGRRRAQYAAVNRVLPRRWNFEEHFRQIAPRIVTAASELGRLLPNVGGPSHACRRLYAGVARSMALYGAPIWADKLTPANKALLRRPQRIVAIRVCRAYVTVGWAAACVLAGTPPWELVAGVLADAHMRRIRSREAGNFPAPEEVRNARKIALRGLREKWKEDLENSPYGTRTIGAVLPSLDRWLDRTHGSVGYRLAQVLTGHGCFGHYLHRIGREPTPACHECGETDDTAQHTLEVCNHWVVERSALATAIRTDDLSLHSVVAAMLNGERSWEAVVSFCDTVVSQKETKEREREEDPNALPIRRRRLGRRRRR
ncbi:uncharacterized protein LOC134791583, partial [Cydia splendana]|uniref:uncharacterized protein LOC134791583 n=1 Tax=Cydia splendana TaxID=1100963 RepID=UPI00300D3277